MYQPIQSPPALYSVNQLKTWSRCKKKYFYESIAQLYWPTEQSHFQLGRSVHKLLEFQAEGLDCTPVLGQAALNIQQAWELLQAAPITHFPILASEWPFWVPFHGITLTGRIDRIARTPEGNVLFVIDWKTGTAVPRHPETDWQTQMYLYALWQSRSEFGYPALTPEQITFIYVEVKDSVRLVEIPYSTEQKEAFEDRLSETLQQICQETDYALPAQCPDLFCPYRSICGIETLSNESISTETLAGDFC